MKEAVGGFAEGLSLMLSNPSSEAYAYSTYLPVSSSRIVLAWLKVVSTWVPS